MRLEQAVCVVTRDASTKIQTTVPEWELKVLRAIHGAANVAVLRTEPLVRRSIRPATVKDGEEAPTHGETVTEAVTEFDAEDAYAALQRKYGRLRDKDSNPILPQIYGDADALGYAVERKNKRAA